MDHDVSFPVVMLELGIQEEEAFYIV